MSNDFERPLSKRGFKNAGSMGAELALLGYLPDVVISSPAQRAKQTCFILCDSMGFESERIRWNKDVYAAYTVTLLHLLNALNESQQRVMLVGHNPAMEDLLLHLCGDKIWQTHSQANGKLFTTGNIAELHFNDSWRNLTMGEGTVKLIRLLRPKEL